MYAEYAELNSLQDPVALSFADEFPAENTICTMRSQKQPISMIRMRRALQQLSLMPTFSQIHIFRQQISVHCTFEVFSFEVLLERAIPHRVVLECVPPVSREGAGQDGDVAKDRLERFVEDV